MKPPHLIKWYITILISLQVITTFGQNSDVEGELEVVFDEKRSDDIFETLKEERKAFVLDKTQKLKDSQTQQPSMKERTRINIYALSSSLEMARIIKPAVRIAYQFALRNDPTLLSDYDIYIHYANSSCDKMLTFDGFDSKLWPSVLLGPVCPLMDQYPLVNVTERYNVPLVTTGWREGVVNDIIGDGSEKVVKIQAPFLDSGYHFGMFITSLRTPWSQIVFFYEDTDSPNPNSCENFIKSVIASCGYPKSNYENTTGWTPQKTLQILKEYRFSKKMFIVCGSNAMTRQLMTSAYEAEMYNCRNFRWIIADPYDAGNFKTGVWKNDDTWTVKEKIAYSNLLVFGLKQQTESSTCVKIREKLMRNYRRRRINLEKIPDYVYGVQESVLLYLYALRRLLDIGKSPTNGTLVSQLMTNVSLDGFCRFIRIDSYGERMEDYDVFALSDQNSGIFESAAEVSNKCTEDKVQLGDSQVEEPSAQKQQQAEKLFEDNMQNFLPYVFKNFEAGNSDRISASEYEKKWNQKLREFTKKIDLQENDDKLDVIAALFAVLLCLVFIFLPLCLRHRKLQKKKRAELRRNETGDEKDKSVTKRGCGLSGRTEETSTSTRMSYLEEDVSTTSTSSSTSKDSLKNLMAW